MAVMSSFPIVIDTNVLFEGLTKQGGASGFIIDAWLAGLLEVCVSNALAYEYEEVLSHKISKPRWQKLQPTLGTLLNQSRFTIIYYSWRPASPDAGDDLVIDCAMNAAATVITSNLRDFQNAKDSLGLQVMSPSQLVIKLGLIGT
jgi:predicted nucleic acid-binding protein